MSSAISASLLPVYEVRTSRPKVWLGYRIAAPPKNVQEHILKLLAERFPNEKFARFNWPDSGDKETEEYHAAMVYGLSVDNYSKCKEYMEQKAGLTAADLQYPVLDEKDPNAFNLCVGTKMTPQGTVLVWIAMQASARYTEVKKHIRETYLTTEQLAALVEHPPHVAVLYAETARASTPSPVQTK